MQNMLIEIHKDGMLLEMGDGTKWDIDPYDASICCTWTPTNDMSITKNKNEIYPYNIKDDSSGSVVRAKPCAEYGRRLG
jgi:hypothetical protein